MLATHRDHNYIRIWTQALNHILYFSAPLLPSSLAYDTLGSGLAVRWVQRSTKSFPGKFPFGRVLQFWGMGIVDMFRVPQRNTNSACSTPCAAHTP